MQEKLASVDNPTSREIVDKSFRQTYWKISSIRFRISLKSCRSWWKYWRYHMDANTDVICPKCGAAVAITDVLARPFLDSEREKLKKEAQERANILERREIDVEKKQQTLAATEKSLRVQQTEVDRVVEERLRAEREILTQEAIKKTASSYIAKLQSAEKELAENKVKLVEAEKVELEARLQRHAIEGERRNV